MVKQIEWTDNAIKQTKNIIHFLRLHFSENTVEDFKLKLEKKPLFIAENPLTGRKVQRKKRFDFLILVKTIAFIIE